MVEYTADFVMLKPKDMSKASGVLRYDAPNRGNILGRDPSDAVYLSAATCCCTRPGKAMCRRATGTAHPHRAGGAERGWQLDHRPLPQRAHPCRGHAGDGAARRRVQRHDDPLCAGEPRQHAARLLAHAAHQRDRRARFLPPSDWKFANCDATTPFPGTADGTKICLNGGFDPKYLYELVYVAKDPKVMGVGLAALRDTVSFFRSAAADSAGAANPLAGRITHGSDKAPRSRATR